MVGVIAGRARRAGDGVYNVAGDGALTIHQIAARMGKTLPRAAAGAALGRAVGGRRTRPTQYGPEQLRFLQYRPVLDNRRLKEVFGYRPRKTSAEAFDDVVDGAPAAAESP